MSLPNTDVQIALYRQMLTLRRFEEAVARAYREAKIPGFVHLYIGEEAIASGVCAHLNQDDYVGSTHRGHAHALAKGVPAREAMAELFGRSTGVSGGRGGSMHYYAPEHGLLGTNGIVGPSILIASGAAYSAKYRGTSQVAVAFFGDGAANTGSFHEGVNLASIWKLPVVFVCENNLYATELPFMEATAGRSVAARASAYDMPGEQIDGQDVLAVYEAAGEAIARARSGEGPSILECRTYRYVGHCEGQRLVGYRTQEEIDRWRERDPIALFSLHLLGEKLATPEDLVHIESEVAGVVQDALDYSAGSPWPSPEEAGTKVFANPI